MQKNSGVVVKSAQDAPVTQAAENARKQVKAAKQQVKWLKAQLKQARAAVKAAKELRKQAEAAEEAAKNAAPPKRAKSAATARKRKVVRARLTPRPANRVARAKTPPLQPSGPPPAEVTEEPPA